jgi:hypothetical protein
VYRLKLDSELVLRYMVDLGLLIRCGFFYLTFAMDFAFVKLGILRPSSEVGNPARTFEARAEFLCVMNGCFVCLGPKAVFILRRSSYLNGDAVPRETDLYLIWGIMSFPLVGPRAETIGSTSIVFYDFNVFLALEIAWLTMIE